MSHPASLDALLVRLLPAVQPDALARFLGVQTPEACVRLLTHARTRDRLATLVARMALADGFSPEAPPGRLALADQERIDTICAMAGAWQYGRVIRRFLTGSAVAAIVARIGRDAHALAFDPDAPPLPESTADQADIKDPIVLSTRILSDGQQLLMSWLAQAAPAADTLLGLRRDVARSDHKQVLTRLPDGTGEAMDWIIRKACEADV